MRRVHRLSLCTFCAGKAPLDWSGSDTTAMTNRCAKRQYSSGHSFLSLSVRRNTINNQNKLCVPVRWNSSQAEGRSDGKEENDNTVPYSVDDHVAEAESHLKNQFGPYAKIVVHKLYNQPQHHQKSNNSNTDDGEEEQGASSLQTEGNTSSAPQNVYYRVSATFKLLGFPIELAATKGHKVKETIEACLYQALSSDIEFIHPSSGNNNHTHRNTLTPYQQELKAILTELKGHCQFLSRSLKFSVKPPHAEILQQRGQRGSAGGATPEAEPEAPQEEEEDVNRRLWRCRVYLKDEWGLTNRMVLDQEYYGDSPRLALAKSVSSLRDKFAKEVERYNTQPIGLREVRRLLLKCYEGSRRSEATLQCRQEENREDGEEASSSDVVRYTENHEEDETLPNYKIREKNIREKRMQKQKELYTQRAQRPASTKFSLFQYFRAELTILELQNGNKTVVTAGKQPKPVAVQKAATLLALHRLYYTINSCTTTTLPAWSGRRSMLVHPQPHRSPADYMSAGKGALSRPRLLSQHVERALAALSATSRRTSADPALTRTPQYALLGSAALVSHAEGEHTRLHVSSVSAVPLLTKIKWQVAEMSSIIAHHLNANNPQGNPVTPEEVVSVQLTGLGLLNHNEEKWADPLQYGLVSETYTLMDTESTVVLFSVVVSFLGNVIWNSSGGGRYPLELEAYSQALYALLDEYSFLLPSAPSGQWPSGTVNYYHTLKGQSSGFFATGALLEEALKAHHGFDVVKLHKGKWNCYALLGTLTLQLMGAPYQTHYLFNKEQAKWFCTLTVADAASGSRQILMQRMSKKKGDAWRSACIAALKENFPQAYADALRKYPDVDLTADHSAQGSKYRALPREKRIQHIASLFHMVYAFGKDDLGWQQMRVRLRNTSGDLGLPQWVAELEVQMEGEEEFRVVAASPACAQSKLARRLVIYQVAEQYFPKELATYAKLGRADGENPSHDPSLKNTTVYKRGGIPFVQQVVQLIEAKNPSYAPVSWRLRLVHCAAGGSTADSGFTSYQDLFDGDVALDELLLSPSLLVLPLSLTWEAEVLGNNGELSIATHRATYTPAAEGSSATPQTEGAVAALMTALRSASIHLCGGEAEVLWSEYETHSLPACTTRRELVLYLFHALWGSTPDTADGVGSFLHVESVQLGDFWFTVVLLPYLGMIPLAKAIGATKRGSQHDALSLAARLSFPRHLLYASNNDIGIAALAREILLTPVMEVLPLAIRAQIVQQEEAKWRLKQTPFQLLTQCIRRDYYDENTKQYTRHLRLERVFLPTHNRHECRLYLQKHRRVVKAGEAQLVGYGSSGENPSAALHLAAVMALQEVFALNWTQPSLTPDK